MLFQKLTEHIYKLDLRWYGFPVGVFLVREGAEWTLVDAGARWHPPTIIPAVRAQLDGAPLTRVVLTHGHPDHAEGLPAILQEFNCPVWAHEREVPLLRGETTYAQIRPTWWAFRLVSALYLSRPLDYRVDHALRESDTVCGCRVIAAPGHTPGQIALLHERDRALLCADAWQNMFGRPRGPIAIFTPDRAEAARTMRKLAGLNFDVLLAAHGPPYRGGLLAFLP